MPVGLIGLEPSSWETVNKECLVKVSFGNLWQSLSQKRLILQALLWRYMAILGKQEVSFSQEKKITIQKFKCHDDAGLSAIL